MPRIETTDHKFYHKWLYKATLSISGVGIFRTFSIPSIVAGEFADQHSSNPYSLITKASANKEILSRLGLFLSAYNKSSYGKRIENNLLDLYTNDESMFEKIISEFESVVYHAFKPNPETVDLLDQTGSIIAKRLPHNKYRYKVFLLPHKMDSKDEKEQYLAWVDLQGERVRISDAVKKWFINTDWNWDRRYILVENEPTLLMLKLRSAEVVGRVYEYIVVDK